MKQEIKTTEAIFPMPVLMISTFNEDGSVDVMNAAWGTMLDRDKVALNLTKTYKTVENIKARKGFVVHIADAKHVVEADYFGIASGNTEKEKFAKSGMTFTKSDLVDAPVVINEELSKALKENPFMKAEAIRKIYIKNLKVYLDSEFEEYCTCDDYYQPVVEDFELEYRINDWCRKNGFKIISCEGDGDDSGFEPDSVRRWIKYR